MRWGDKVKFLLEVYEESGTLPDALAKRPKLSKVWEFPQKVWRELSGSRQQRFQGVGEIPFSEVALYCMVHRFTPEETQDTWEAVHTFDLVWVNQVSALKAAQSSS